MHSLVFSFSRLHSAKGNHRVIPRASSSFMVLLVSLSMFPHLCRRYNFFAVPFGFSKSASGTAHPLSIALSI